MSLVTRPARVLTRRAVRRYGPGPRLEDAVEATYRICDHGLDAVIAYWDPPGVVPRDATAHALAALDAAPDLGDRVQVAVKAPAFGAPWEARSLLTEVADAARERGRRLHFDALDLPTATPTLRLLRHLSRSGADVGFTLPGSWRRSLADAEVGVELGLGLRLVRGQWPELDRDAETATLHALARALAGQARHVAVASHDPDLVAATLPVLLEAGTPCELQLLYGLPGRRVLDVARDLGVPARVYVPWGHLDLPYDPSKARTTVQVAWWLARDALRSRDGLLGWTISG